MVLACIPVQRSGVPEVLWPVMISPRPQTAQKATSGCTLRTVAFWHFTIRGPWRGAQLATGPFGSCRNYSLPALLKLRDSALGTSVLGRNPCVG